MQNSKSQLIPYMVIIGFVMMAIASAPSHRTTYHKPVVYPCVYHAALTYSPILVKINIDANYTMKDLAGVRHSDPSYIMDELKSLNYSYKLADGVTPNLVLHITYTNDGYDHYGVNLYVDWQGQGNFTITLPANYVTANQLIIDMTKEFNRWITNGWHEGNCK